MRLIDADAIHTFVEDKVAEGKDGWKSGVGYEWAWTLSAIDMFPTIDAEPVKHGRCDVCSGKAVLTQGADNGYSLEIDSEQQEASLWCGDNCLAVFHIDFCPNCGARMDLEV